VNASAETKPKLPGSLNANRILSQWITFEDAKRVTIHPGKVEIGQGILTALAQIAADELDVEFKRVDVKAAATDESPDEGVTSGSRSVVDSGMAIRHACAAARSIFLSVVAQRTGVSLEQIRVVDGIFIGPRGEIGSYWADAHTGLLDCEAPAKVTPKSIGERKVAGRSMARLDLADKIFGAPRFIQDLRLPGMWFARVVRPNARGAKLAAVPPAPAGAQIVVDGNFLAVVCDSEAAVDAAAARVAATAKWEATDTLPDIGTLRDYLESAPSDSSVTAEQPAKAALTRTYKSSFFRPYLAHASIGLCCAVARFDDGKLDICRIRRASFCCAGISRARSICRLSP
jgi:hypothetical protein